MFVSVYCVKVKIADGEQVFLDYTSRNKSVESVQITAGFCSTCSKCVDHSVEHLNG